MLSRTNARSAGRSAGTRMWSARIRSTGWSSPPPSTRMLRTLPGDAGGIAASTVGGMEQPLSLFPSGTERDVDGMLLLGGCRADELALEHDTPALIVDEPALRVRAREYRAELSARWPRSRVVFASKA